MFILWLMSETQKTRAVFHTFNSLFKDFKRTHSCWSTWNIFGEVIAKTWAANFVFALADWHKGSHRHTSTEVFILDKEHIFSGGREICRDFGKRLKCLLQTSPTQTSALQPVLEWTPTLLHQINRTAVFFHDIYRLGNL